MHVHFVLERVTIMTTTMVIIIMKTTHQLEEGEVEDVAEAALDHRPTSYIMKRPTIMANEEDKETGLVGASPINKERDLREA